MRFTRLLPSVGVFGILFAAPLFAQLKVLIPPPLVEEEVPDSGEKSPAKTLSDAEQDAKALEGAGLKSDDSAGLIEFLKSRTVPDSDRERIEAIIRRMNVDASFDDRLAAQRELLQIGGPAVALLKKAKNDKDPEVAYRAGECERLMEQDKKNGSDVTLAVVRALARMNSPEAVAALFAFLPLADTPQLIGLIQQAMTANAGKDGKPIKLLADALADESPLRRKVAAVALASGGTPENRVRFPNVYPKLVDLAKSDADPGVRFAVAKVLLLESREKAAVPALIDLLPDMTRGQSWQAEELLAQIAGKDAPDERCIHATNQNGQELATNKKAREQCRDAWKKWWDGAAANLDLAKTDLKLTVKGELVVITQGWNNFNGQQQINVTRYGSDDQVLAQMSFASQNAFDAVVRDDGSVVTFETVFQKGMNQGQLKVRDATGKVTATWTVSDKFAQNFGFQPKGLVSLENGNVIAVHQNGFVEFDPKGKEVLKYTRPENNKQPKNDLSGVVRLKTGETVLSVSIPNQSKGELVFLDAKGKEIEDRKPIPTGFPNYRATFIQTGEDTVLVFEPNNGRAQEYDLKTGKALNKRWNGVGNPNFVEKLPNGNLMYSDNNQYPPPIVERSPDGKQVWSKPNRNPNEQVLRATVR